MWIWPIYILFVWVLSPLPVEAVENPWALDKRQIFYTKKAVEAVKERSWGLATYYINKVEDKEIKDFILWLRNNLDSSYIKPSLIWPVLGIEEKKTLDKALTWAPNPSLLRKIDTELLLKQQNVQRKIKIESVLPKKYRIRGNTEEFISIWKKTKDTKILYNYLKWCEKNNYTEQGLPILIKYLPLIEGVKTEPEWWTLKKLYIRDVIFSQQYKLYSSIYLLAKNHGFQSGINYAEAEWLAGWIALEFLHKPKQAYEHFYHMYNNVKMPLSKSRAAYWVGRSLYESPIDSNYWYKLAAEYNTTFYGQLALLKIDPANNLKPNLMETCEAKYTGNPLLKAFYLSSYLEENKLSIFLLKKLQEEKSCSASVCAINQVSLKSHNPYIILQAALLTEVPQGARENLYPLCWVKNYNTKDKITPLVLALMRQESAFNTQAESLAGAQGLMQLLPSSAVRMCQGLNVYKCMNTSLFMPEHNVKLGKSYLEKDLQYYKGSVVLAIAAYNAGVKAVDKWVKERGDVLSYTNLEEKINWIESIPYAETRDYVMRVLANMQVYKSILNTPTYTIKDLEKDLTYPY